MAFGRRPKGSIPQGRVAWFTAEVRKNVRRRVQWWRIIPDKPSMRSRLQLSRASHVRGLSDGVRIRTLNATTKFQFILKLCDAEVRMPLLSNYAKPPRRSAAALSIRGSHLSTLTDAQKR